MLRPLKIRQYLSAMQARGFTAERVLAGTGLGEMELANPACLLDLEQYHGVVANIIALTGNPAIGLEIGKDVHIASMGIVGYAMATSSTFRQAITFWMQYANSSMMGLPIRQSLIEEPDGSWGVTALATEPIGSLFAFYFEETMSASLSVPVELIGQPLRLKEVRLSYPAPPHAALYHETFRCPIYFDEPVTSIVTSSPVLDTPMPSNDDKLNELCLRQCGQIMREIGRRGALTSRLRSLLLKNRGALPSLEDAACRLGLSARTLRRHLQRENTTYQTILDEFRSDLAKEYLATGLKPKEIGFLLGYTHPNAFRLAFKSWTGQTMKTYQDSHRQT
ncbi:AraC family transcriptional regulator [Ferribacterium limneticum]|uniref:AraC family transcriptional regulator n=1 Tax=Ferribacterium limneticum TaxID=76259 RepID=UPI001CF92B00|nr:AraC family transcriptional regulator [Ferribacterium limneticum]UCV23644.1 AraC family transcriptional regulator [Ferribacterium limneticum]